MPIWGYLWVTIEDNALTLMTIKRFTEFMNYYLQVCIFSGYALIQLPDCIFWIYDYVKNRIKEKTQPNNQSRTSTIQLIASSIEAKGVDKFLRKSKESIDLLSSEEIETLRKMIGEWSKRNEQKLQTTKIQDY